MTSEKFRIMSGYSDPNKLLAAENSHIKTLGNAGKSECGLCSYKYFSLVYNNASVSIIGMPPACLHRSTLGKYHSLFSPAWEQDTFEVYALREYSRNYFHD